MWIEVNNDWISLPTRGQLNIIQCSNWQTCSNYSIFNKTYLKIHCWFMQYFPKIICLCDWLFGLMFAFVHIHGHIGNRQKPRAGRQSPTLFDKLQVILHANIQVLHTTKPVNNQFGFMWPLKVTRFTEISHYTGPPWCSIYISCNIFSLYILHCFFCIYIYIYIYTVKPVFKGHLIIPEKASLHDRCPFVTGSLTWGR